MASQLPASFRFFRFFFAPNPQLKMVQKSPLPIPKIGEHFLKNTKFGKFRPNSTSGRKPKNRKIGTSGGGKNWISGGPWEG